MPQAKRTRSTVNFSKNLEMFSGDKEDADDRRESHVSASAQPPSGLSQTSSSFFNGYTFFEDISKEDAENAARAARERASRTSSFNKGRSMFENGVPDRHEKSSGNEYREERRGLNTSTSFKGSVSHFKNLERVTSGEVCSEEQDAPVTKQIESSSSSFLFTESLRVFEANAKNAKDDFSDIAEVVDVEERVPRTKSGLIKKTESTSTTGAKQAHSPTKEAPLAETTAEAEEKRTAVNKTVTKSVDTRAREQLVAKESTTKAVKTANEANPATASLNDKQPNVVVVFLDLDGSVKCLADEIARGAKAVLGAGQVQIFRMSTMETPTRADTRGVPELDVNTTEGRAIIENATTILFGFPTIYGRMHTEAKLFFKSMGALRKKGTLTGKPAGLFTSASDGTQGMRMASLDAIGTLAGFGMVYVPLGYGVGAKVIKDQEAPIGASIYGCGNIHGCQPTEDEISMAQYQGAYASIMCTKLVNRC